MIPKEKAQQLINEFRIILMNEDTDCGNEILCTLISKRCALIAVEEILDTLSPYGADNNARTYWREVKKEIELL